MLSFIPCNALKPYIQSMIVSESVSAQSYTVLPGTSVVLGFQFKGRLAYRRDNAAVSLATAGVTGILNKFRVFENTADTGTVLVIFNEAGAVHFFREPLYELYNESLSLEYFVKRDQLVALQERLSSANDNDARVKVVENFLLSRLDDRKEDLLAVAAIKQIHQYKGNIRMADLAGKLYTSKSPLEKRFRRVVGTTPKKFANIIRMNSALLTMQSPLSGNTDHWLGFYDQAHFIHNFKDFTGATPEQYVKKLLTEK